MNVIQSAMRLIDSLCNEHKAFRRAALVWACWLITWTVQRCFGDNTPDVSAGTAAALASVCGLLTVVVGLYQWSREREDKP
jgi:hypothetical protein